VITRGDNRLNRHILFIFLLLGTGIPVPARAADAVEAARAFRQVHPDLILNRFAQFLAVPNVAGDTLNIRRNAAILRDRFVQRGATMEILELPGASPLVVGRLPAPGATRTLGIYVHYDGQPVDSTAWTDGPWSPVLRDGPLSEGGKPIPWPGPGQTTDPEWRIYARSAGDDKAPFAALWAALDALDAADIARTSNLVFFFEGEEEAGSPHLEDYLRTYADRLQADVWLIADGPAHQSRRPQLVFGVRGVTSMQITVYGPEHGLHSGHYGNWAPNPALLLSQLLASMKDADGNVLVEGYLDQADPLSEADREALATVPDVDRALMDEFGLARTEGTGSLAERLLLPSLNITGLASAKVGREARNVIPPTATASLDLRLVRGCKPEVMQELVEAHIRKQGYFIVREDPDHATRLAHPRITKVTRGRGYPAARTSMDDPIVRPLVAAAERAAGEPVILMPSLGGSLPLYLFNEILEKPVVIVPIANHDDNQHAADENLRLANLWYGIDLWAAVLTMED